MKGMNNHTQDIISYIIIFFNRKFVRGWHVNCLSVGTEQKRIFLKARYLMVFRLAKAEGTWLPEMDSNHQPSG